MSGGRGAQPDRRAVGANDTARRARFLDSLSGRPYHAAPFAKMRFVILFIASAAFTGYFPVASGTVGSAVAVPLFWLFDRLRIASVPFYLFTFVLMIAGACWVAGKAEELLHEHDSHKIVIDEVVGYLAATLFLAPSWQHALVAFLIFRLLDVIKPFPAGYIDEHLPGGYGVVLDDVVSGLYSNVATRILFALF